MQSLVFNTFLFSDILTVVIVTVVCFAPLMKALRSNFVDVNNIFDGKLD